MLKHSPASAALVSVSLACLALALAHVHPVRNKTNCTCEPGAIPAPAPSYHIHVMFCSDIVGDDGHFSDNPHGSKYVLASRKDFVAHLNFSHVCASIKTKFGKATA